jgi:conjugative transfer region protein TrbK
MNTKLLDRLPTIAAVALIVLVFAACAIHLRGDEDQISSPASADQGADGLATKLAHCRSVTYEQKDDLAECRKSWAEKRRQFLGQTSRPSSQGTPSLGSPLFVSPEGDREPEFGLPDHSSTPQSGQD